MEREKIEAIIESLLFVAGEPVSFRRMCEIIAEAPKAEVQAALEELIKKFEAPDRGLTIAEVAGGWQLQTDSDNALWVGRLLQARPIRLSRPSLETLAMVAYKQPVTKAEIDDIRGVDSGGVLKTLLDYGFIRIAGRKDVPGKPLIYGTDRRFMEFFRMKSLSELPTLREMEEIQAEQLGAAQNELPLDGGAALAAAAGIEGGIEGATEGGIEGDPTLAGAEGGPAGTGEPDDAAGVITRDQSGSEPRPDPEPEAELEPGEDPGAEFDTEEDK